MRILNGPKAFAAIVLCLQLFGFAANATETPYARNCRIEGGLAWVVNFSETSDVMLCRFGSAAIGAAEFAELKWNQQSAGSIEALLGSSASSGGSATCSEYGARYAEAKDSNDTTWGLCVFSDGSVSEVNTLARGEADTRNASLIRALR
jgi:hypothetical protein